MDAVTKKMIRVFVSHNSKDREPVDKLIEIMRLYDAAERLKFIVAEKMPKSADWRKWIHKNVVDANVLFFIMISQKSNWEWCIYEAGLFAGSRVPNFNVPIIVFYNQFNHLLPSPLAHLQAVKATQIEVEEFLIQFYGSTEITGIEPCLNKNFSKNSSA